MISSHQSNTPTELESIFLQGNQLKLVWVEEVLGSPEVNYKIFNNLFGNFTRNGGERDLTIVFSSIFSTFPTDGTNRERWYFLRHLHRFSQAGGNAVNYLMK